MENKTNKKDLSLWMECLTVLTLAATLTFVNCQEKSDAKTPIFAAAALASRGSGTVATATGTAATYTIGGTITGLTATGLVLQNNAGNNLTVASGATSFTFSTAIATGTAYAVTVKTQPTGLTCTVSSGTGTATANVTTPSITCAAVTYTIGGTITGLTATGLVLQNNAGNDLTVASGATTFTFSTAIATGTAYAVTVKTQPTGLFCTVTSGTGTATANVTAVTLACVTAIVRNWGVFTDNNNGTIQLAVTAGTFGGQTYTAQTLTWMKCSHGQAWKSSTNDCTGTGTATAYGATGVQYCNIADQSCNDAGTGLLNGTGTSSAYTACNGLNAGAGTYGKTNWRVPTKNELKLLIECNTTTTMPNDGADCGGSPSPSINTLFPNTVATKYSSSTTASPTSDAWFVDFLDSRVDSNTKGTSKYVRCVSGP
ncbi:MAG: DUF1566 domain-containing protein [Leptospiraceae bacterium]|nr:DUF1566 domain-containing protein [Leptospiraceae bacterium]